MKNTIVIVDPFDDLKYKSFYLYALAQRFGICNLRFDPNPFHKLSSQARHTKTLRFILEGVKYIVDGNDFCTINKDLYEWADTYGKVNTPSTTHSKKIVRLCPSFSLRYANPIIIVSHIAATINIHDTTIRHAIGDWIRVVKRASYNTYEAPIMEDPHYLFHCSTLWQSDEWNRNDETVNLYRARFIRAARRVEGMAFEGGLVSSRTDEASSQFNDCLTRPISPSAYLDRLRRSAFVFNTPAYWGCHGWKLGEYMALGKAVLSTPLINDLPAPLEHGKHIHFVDGSEESISEGIQYLMKHPDYRHHLGQNLRAYWQRYGSPEATLRLLGISEV